MPLIIKFHKSIFALVTVISSNNLNRAYEYFIIITLAFQFTLYYFSILYYMSIIIIINYIKKHDSDHVELFMFKVSRKMFETETHYNYSL